MINRRDLGRWRQSIEPFVRTRPWWVAGGTALVLIAGATWLLWPTHSAAPAPPRERQYLAFTACLLTDNQALATPVATAIWAGMQDASLATRAKVQYLAIAGPQTQHNAELFATSLAQGGCLVMFAAGHLAATGIEGSAPHFPLIKYYVIDAEVSQPNVTNVQTTDSSALRVEIQQVVTAAVNAATPGSTTHRAGRRPPLRRVSFGPAPIPGSLDPRAGRVAVGAIRQASGGLVR